MSYLSPAYLFCLSLCVLYILFRTPSLRLRCPNPG